MLRPRPHSKLSTLDLRTKAKGASVDEIEEIVYELGFRNRAAARTLLEELRGANGALGRGASRTESECHRKTTKDAQRPSFVEAQPARPTFPPTEEQLRAVAAFESRGSLKVSAFAGAGKTSTLQLMSATRADRGLYLAFNRAIAKEARIKFAQNVTCKTTHAVAAAQVRSLHGFSRPKMFGSLSPNQLASILALQHTKVDGKVSLTPTQLAHLFLGTVRRFVRSADTEILIDHTPITGRLRGLDKAVANDVRAWVIEQAKSLWSRMIDRREDIPLGHDGYLKFWSLSNPKLDVSFIMLDEAQDTSPVVLSVLAEQKHAQMVYVGDRHQQIYEWRGAVNAMSLLLTDNETKLTQSFRFGSAIATAATRVLRTLGESEPLRGCDGIESIIDCDPDADAVLARTNAMVISEALAALNRERRPHIVGGTQELRDLLKDVYRLMAGEPGSQPDFFGFTSWDEVVAFADSDEGEDIRPFVTLVQQNGVGRLWAAITNSVDNEKDADVVISTAHKAKGREWPSVRIAGDFSSGRTEDGRIPASEARLFYVAITRAKRRLSVDPELLAAFSMGCAIE